MNHKIKTIIHDPIINTKVDDATIPVTIRQPNLELKSELDNVISMIDVDQTYDPNSKNAQSGKAIDEVIQKIEKDNSSDVKYSEQVLTENQKEQARKNIEASDVDHIHYCVPQGEVSQPGIEVEKTQQQIVNVKNLKQPILTSSYDQETITLDYIQGGYDAEKISLISNLKANLSEPITFLGEKTLVNKSEDQIAQVDNAPARKAWTRRVFRKAPSHSVNADGDILVVSSEPYESNEDKDHFSFS